MNEISADFINNWSHQGKTFIQRFFEKVIKSDGCWEWTAGKIPFGYGRLNLNGTRFVAHRCSWVIHFGDIPKGMCVLHTCDNPACVRPDHLFLGTYSDNTRDAMRKGRHIKGEVVGSSKLTSKDVLEIRMRSDNGETFASISRRFGVKESTIRSIVYGKTWKHVTPCQFRHVPRKHCRRV